VSRTDTGLVRLRTATGSRWVVRDADGDRSLDVGLAQLLAMSVSEARAVIDAAVFVAIDDSAVLAPIDEQEVWAAGVTYERSRDGRVVESTDGTVYDRVYVADRPELFFKAPASRVVAAGDPVGIRADSSWNAPEGELGLVVNSAGELFGYVVGNDMSSRSIEGANPLYLPQAKVYDRSCALGPAIVPAWLVEGPFDITLTISRDDAVVFAGATSTAAMARTPQELIGWLTAALEFPAGAVLLTGTGIVPDDDFTLAAGDIVTIDIAGVGTLVNPVVVVGRGTDRALQGTVT
jgi:2-dehydro-3-deoxy-D-arabinonate dehydratase